VHDKDHMSEVITYPSTIGDIEVNKKHNSYVDVLSSMKGGFKTQNSAIIDDYYNKDNNSFNPNQ
jgi:hypothetical protein